MWDDFKQRKVYQTLLNTSKNVFIWVILIKVPRNYMPFENLFLNLEFMLSILHTSAIIPISVSIIGSKLKG